MIQNFSAPFLVTVNNHFGVGIRSKLMALALQLCSQFPVIVNLAVKNDPNCFLGIRHRLMTSGQINDGKSSEAEPDRTREEVTLVVRTAMDDRSGHSPDRLQFHLVGSNNGSVGSTRARR